MSRVQETIIVWVYCSHSVSEIAIKLIIKLIEYLASAHSGRPKDYKTEIYQEKLYWTIAEEYMKQGRRSLLEKYFLKGIETAKGIGLLKSYKLTQGITGEPKIIFQLEKVWE